MAKAKTKTEKAVGSGAKRSQYQRFETETVHRSLLKGAEYNPRVIRKAAKQKLAESLKDHGLVEPLVWNRRTGTLISGHQRLSILDALEGTDDYELCVSVVDVDERTERILNVQLNNYSMQGEFDYDLLGDLAAESEITFSEMGFLETDAGLLFAADDRFAAMFENDDAAEEKGTLKAIKEDRAEMVGRLEEEQSAGFYFVVVCENQDEKAALLTDMGFPIDEEYVHADAIRRLGKADVA